LDPFVGTGTSVAVAYSFGRKSIGIDISEEYIIIANQRFYSPFLFEAI
jgi:site-specific DNA-methyltransferase (adenine-specific)